MASGVNSSGMDMTRIRFAAIIIIALGLLFAGQTLCAEEGKGDDGSGGQASREFVIGATVKLLAKGYVAMGDIDKTKKNSIAKLEKMSDQEFARKYAAICEDMKGLPKSVKDAYGVDEKMDRSGAINKIRSVGKKDLYTIIDSIPDPFIVKHFDAYFAEKGLDFKKSPSVGEAMLFWNSIWKKLDGE